MVQEIYDPHRQRVPILAWTDDLDKETLAQLRNLAAAPYVEHHVAAMADAHVGLGATIGSVFAARNALVPNAVGVDIGCGMCAVRTSLPAARFSRADLEAIVAAIYSRVPVGFDGHPRPQDWEGFNHESSSKKLNQIIQTDGRTKLGTLGGGNHFIELQADPEGRVWVMIHSGSRHAGLKIAEHYAGIAKSLNAMREHPAGRDLEYLPVDTDEGQDYLHDMRWALRYAFENRRRMMETVLDILGQIPADEPFTHGEMINIHHNYADEEEHFGQRLWVHRKGATQATAETIGIIPGSMGTHSYIVRGLGNPQSFTSSSHGAGRVLGRREAKRTLSLEEVRRSMEHVVAPISRATLDEAPQAYKNIEDVMANQKDLVEPLVRLRPLAVVKG
ncbi:RtcB family protein [bacterium]|nr:RtcB family protein [bacterium]